MTTNISRLSNVASLNRNVFIRGGRDETRAKAKHRLDGDFTGFTELRNRLEGCLEVLNELGPTSSLAQKMKVYQELKASLVEALKMNASTRERVLSTLLGAAADVFPVSHAANFTGRSGTYIDPNFMSVHSPDVRDLAEHVRDFLPQGFGSHALSLHLPKEMRKVMPQPSWTLDYRNPSNVKHQRG